MNPGRKFKTSSSCSCNNCVYNSKRPDKDFISNGSRIDKLYYEKYLPLRERKLLDKLIKTRGVYDDIRDRILSLSSVDIAKDTKLSDTQSFRTESDSDTASTVQKLVDLVDRGEYPAHESSVNLHSDCCRCCACRSKIKTPKYKVHMHIPNQEQIDKYLESHRSNIKKDKKRYLYARSESYVSTLKSRVRKYTPTLKKFHSVGRISTNSTNKKVKRHAQAQETSKKMGKKMKGSVRSSGSTIANVFNIKKDSLMLYRDKLKKNKQATKNLKPKEKHDSFTKMTTKKTLGNVICDCKPKTKSTASLTNVEDKHRKRKLPFPRECEPSMCIPGECNPKDCAKILLKGSPADYELKRCFCTLQLKKIQKQKRINNKEFAHRSKTTMTKNKVKYIEPKQVKWKSEIELISNKILFDDNSQSNKKIVAKTTNTEDVPHKTKITSVSATKSPQKEIQTSVRHRKRTPKHKYAEEKQHTFAEKSKSSPNAPRRQAVRISSSFRFDVEFFKEKNSPHALELAGSDKPRHSEKHEQLYSNENKRDIEKKISKVKILHKNKQISNNKLSTPKTLDESDEVMGGQLKRCFCTRKLLKTPKEKSKHQRPKSKMTMTKDKDYNGKEKINKSMNIDSSTITNSFAVSRNLRNLLPYECEPLFCTPGMCDRTICKKRILTRKLKSPKTLSNESNTELKKTTQVALQTRGLDKTKHTEKHNQRYTEKNKTDIEKKNSVVKILHENKQNNNNNNTSTIPKTSHESDQFMGGPLKRCFCTRKLHKALKEKSKHQRPKSKMTITSDKDHNRKGKIGKAMDIDCECKADNISTHKFQTSMAVNKLEPPASISSNLLPYECEPLFCTPGICDTTICKQRILTRKLKRPKTVSKDINTDHKKSIQISTSKTLSTRKLQFPEHKIEKAKEIKSKFYENLNADNLKRQPTAPQKQAVKISSNFRFEIEFYKNKNLTNDDVISEVIDRHENTLSKADNKDVKLAKKQMPKKYINNPNHQMQDKESHKNRRLESKATITNTIKKCLCTLKLQKQPKIKLNKSISKKNMTTYEKDTNIICACTLRNVSTQTKKQSIDYVSSPIESVGLLPYECEPNFCIPGDCDPLLCADRIKKRNREREIKKLKRCFCTLKFHNAKDVKRNRSVIPLHKKMEAISVKSSGTATNKNIFKNKEGTGTKKDFSRMEKPPRPTKHKYTENVRKKSAFSETKYLRQPQKSQSTGIHVPKNKDYETKVKRQSATTPASPAKSRQAVNLSSNFNFNIEFRKDKTRNKDNTKLNMKPRVGVKLTKRKHRY